MPVKAVSLSCVAAFLTWAVAALPAAAQVASSSAYDGSASLSIPGGVTFSLPPVNPVAGSGPPAYSTANTVVSFFNTQNLGALGLPGDTITVTADTLNSSASSPGSTPLTATASASIQNLDFVFATTGVPIPLFELTATTIASTSTAGGGPATGSTTIQGVTLSGSLVGTPITLMIPSTLPVDDVVFNAGGVELIANEQIALPGGIATNAVDLILTSASFGGSTPLSGNLILSHSQAQVTGVSPVPEPATWTMMLLGVAGLGAAARRRRGFAAV